MKENRLNIFYIEKDSSHCSSCYEWDDYEFVFVVTPLSQEEVKEKLRVFVSSMSDIPQITRYGPDYRLAFFKEEMVNHGILFASCGHSFAEFDDSFPTGNLLGDVINLGSLTEDQLLGKELYTDIIRRRKEKEKQDQLEQSLKRAKSDRLKQLVQLRDLAKHFNVDLPEDLK